ncbi:NAC domain-containing protein 72-like [Rutidosis leptorrhynchoides]|uniref:NAC domain-containing protein 72-like n=1 Tax=Rutidosis leptorrhynchoides TaxID=125765 RepID=UPI003A997CF0
MEEQEDEHQHSLNPNPNHKSPSLPPGCQFFPSENQLISHYLTIKTKTNHINPPPSLNLIKELDLYRFDPFDLPESACFEFGREGKRKHWYCFAIMPRVKRGRGEKRRAGSGFWKRSGSVKDIVGAGVQGVVVGTRKCFVFYLGDSVKTCVRTKWIMYEYALIEQKMAEASYVLCRVFAKSQHQCNKLDNHPKFCSKHAKTVRHIGIQCDDTLMNGSRMVKESSIDCAENSDVNRLVTSSDNIFYLPTAVQGSTFAFDGDFIELNDLLCPLEDVN